MQEKQDDIVRREQEEQVRQTAYEAARRMGLQDADCMDVTQNALVEMVQARLGERSSPTPGPGPGRGR
jgi:hypothetical protein